MQNVILIMKAQPLMAFSCASYSRFIFSNFKLVPIEISQNRLSRSKIGKAQELNGSIRLNENEFRAEGKMSHWSERFVCGTH